MHTSNRRNFLRTSALSAWAASRVLGANDRINVAVIGLGGRGKDHVKEFVRRKDVDIVALCDVDQAHLEMGQAQVKRATGVEPKGYGDMRDVFADPNVHAVSLPVPNHWHALATIWACQAGKDVYVEKPACHDPYEGLQMVAAARKYKRMVQVGSQGRSIPHKIHAVELLKSGAIGELYMARGLCFKRRKSIGHTPVEPVPAGVNWDLFRGPAPMIPFSKNRFLYNWHWFWDTGNGDLGNQGVHEMDIARWGLDVAFPTSVVASGGKYVYRDDQETPNTLVARCDYGPRELVFEVRGLETGHEADLSKTDANCIGDLFYGSDGWMSLDEEGYRIYKGTPGVLSQSGVYDKSIASSTAPHIANFLDAVRSRRYQDLHADIDIGRISADLCHLSNIGYRLGGRRLDFDPSSEKFHEAEANALAHPPYRAPYTIPAEV